MKIKRVKKMISLPISRHNRKAPFLWSSLTVKVIACVSLRRSSKFESEMRLFTDSINCDSDEAISRRTQRCASEGVAETKSVRRSPRCTRTRSRGAALKANPTGSTRASPAIIFMPDKRDACRLSFVD